MVGFVFRLCNLMQQLIEEAYLSLYKVIGNNKLFRFKQIAYHPIEEQEGRKRLLDDYISFVSLLADPRCGGIVHLLLLLGLLLLVGGDTF